MDVDYAVRSSRKAGLHQLVVATKVRGVECSAELTVDEILPGHWQAEYVELVFGDKVAHLTGAITAASVC